MIIHVSGCDGVGKSSVCQKLTEEFNAKLTHFSNPKDINDGKNQYLKFLSNIDINQNYVCDRFHDGEWVYAPIYRKYIANYMQDIEQIIIDKHNYLFVYVTADLKTIIDRTRVRGEDFVKEEHFQLVLDNFKNNFLIEQKMPFTIVDTTNAKVEQTFEYVKEDVKKLELIWNQYKHCSKCDDTLKPLALPRGNIRAKYMIVGQNPGGKGKSNKRYVTMFSEGSTSKLLIEALKKAGIYLDCWFTNIVNCSTDNNKVTTNQKNECIGNLQMQIELIQPEKIFTLGKEATKTVKDNFPNLNVVEVPHPSYIKRFKLKNLNSYIDMFK